MEAKSSLPALLAQLKSAPLHVWVNYSSLKAVGLYFSELFLKASVHPRRVFPLDSFI